MVLLTCLDISAIVTSTELSSPSWKAQRGLSQLSIEAGKLYVSAEVCMARQSTPDVSCISSSSAGAATFRNARPDRTDIVAEGMSVPAAQH